MLASNKSHTFDKRSLINYMPHVMGADTEILFICYMILQILVVNFTFIFCMIFVIRL